MRVFKKTYPFLAAVLNLLLLLAFPVGAQDGSAQEETLLMFVGEDLEVLSIASRREESAWQAPAIAEVISRKRLAESGTRTLSQALARQAGFYMGETEWGTRPYLRGIPDSVLFLYDTVPVISDVSKSLHPLDYELSLAPIKRIEIIRGPGSVLWGPDAFAGIVNIVPLTGKDISGAETGILYRHPGDQGAAYANFGYDAGHWDGFLSLSARTGEENAVPYHISRFWGADGSPVLPEERTGSGYPDDSHYLEALGRFAYGDWLTVTGRIADYERSYTMYSQEQGVSWPESRGLPSGFVKLEAKKSLNHSTLLRFAGMYSVLRPEQTIINKILKQQERTGYAELIFDKTLLSGTGRFTGGLSYRDKTVKDAPIWEGYLPEYLGEENQLLLPIINKTDYSNRLFSVFGQYQHKIGAMDLWVGLRDDMHDEYEDHLSFNAGIAWSPRSWWMGKLIYGTAYRTPFARQLLQDQEPELEKIENLSLQIAWEPGVNWGVRVCGFYNWIENHIIEDPYAGLSLPNEQDIAGVEIQAHYAPHPDLELGANLTLTDHSGPSETYKYNDYTFIRPDGTEEKHFVDLEYGYDPGADTLFNLTATWQPHERFTAFARLGYFSQRTLSYLHNDGFISTTVPGAWLGDLSLTLRDPFFKDSSLEFSVKNLSDRDYEMPGSYSVIDGMPFSLCIQFRKQW